MALSQSMTYRGITIPQAYIKVIRIIGNKSSVTCTVGVFSDVSSSEQVFDMSFSFDYDIDGDNPIAQSYAHIKTIPEFLTAIDC